MKHRDTVKGIVAGVVLLGGSVVAQQAPAVHAAPTTGLPRFTRVIAAHQWVEVYGYIYDGGAPATIRFWGGKKGSYPDTVFATVVVRPAAKPSTLSPCLLGVLCNEGGFTAQAEQAHDPCGGGGFPVIRVALVGYDGTAWPNKVAIVACPPPFVG